MPAFQLLAGYIALGNDNNTIVYRGVDEPITYPEALVLGFIHGEAAIRDLSVLGTVERSNADEKARLASLYGEPVIAMLFPGIAAKLPTDDPELPQAAVASDAPAEPEEAADAAPPRPKLGKRVQPIADAAASVEG